MKGHAVIIPSPSGRDEFVELARRSTGTLYRKQILPWGPFQHPTAAGQNINVDKAFAAKLVSNFKAGHCDIVQVPIVDGKNAHSEDPLRNVGEVVDLTYDDGGVYAVIDARKKEYADELGKTLIGASAMMHLNYKDTKTGKQVGPTLLHVAVTNRPYLTNLTDYEQVIAASADSFDEAPVVLTPAKRVTEQEPRMDLDDMIAALKSEHGVDVMDLQARVEHKDDALISALSNVLGEATGRVDLSASSGDVTVKDVADAVIELAQEKVELSATVAMLREQNEIALTREAEAEVDAAVTEGRILPVQRDAMLELRLTNQDMFDRLLPTDSIVALSEIGVTTHDEPGSHKLKADIERLASLANDRAGRK